MHGLHACIQHRRTAARTAAAVAATYSRNWHAVRSFGRLQAGQAGSGPYRRPNLEKATPTCIFSPSLSHPRGQADSIVQTPPFESSVGPGCRRCQCPCGYGYVIIHTCIPVCACVSSASSELDRSMHTATGGVTAAPCAGCRPLSRQLPRCQQVLAAPSCLLRNPSPAPPPADSCSHVDEMSRLFWDY